MSIAVTGATGRYGRRAIDALIRRGVRPDDIVALGRNDAALADLTPLGVRTRQADYNDRAALDAAFTGVGKVLFVSGTDVGNRIHQHRNVVDAAARAQVTLIAYTSVPRADTTALLVAADHKPTEAYIRESGLPYVFLRNGWYMANYTDMAAAYVEAGAVLGAARNGRVSAATHADYADAAAVVLTEDGHANSVYELGGDRAFTMTEFAQALSNASGRTVDYTDLSTDRYVAALQGFGFPAELAEVFADGDLGVARGDLQVETGDLSRLIGRPTTTMPEAVAAALG
ncbi:SDR family oxidoreductase [Rhodococcus opacus]|uniref:SDR family oxidoreductase n=1 Tax=Rhodococcus opacus TaxID=37919 RepID=A0AAX3YTJ4_RHOOP|nr:SDR family oxidoreductase [Rhodococcus opacus]MCZ4587541.1 SDR family oxidoreductase [Rhodococcus opacus]WLF51457.1 SDR family oxidoreductase [Rhodococcus opacus]